MPFILNHAKFGLILLFPSFPGAVSGAMSLVSSAQLPFSKGKDDGVMPAPSLVWPQFETVAMLVAPSLPAPSAGGEVLWALWRAETDLPYSVSSGSAAMFDAMPSCVLCSGFAHPGRSPPCFQFPLLAATLVSVFKEIGFIVLAPVSVVFSVDIHCWCAGKAKEGKCQKLKPSFEDYDLCEVRFAVSVPQVWLLERQLGSSIVRFFSAVAQVAAAAAAYLDGLEPLCVFFLLGVLASLISVFVVAVDLASAAWFAFVGHLAKMTAAATCLARAAAHKFVLSLSSGEVVSCSILAKVQHGCWATVLHGHVLGLRVLVCCDITSMSQRGVRALAMMVPRLSGSSGLVPTTPSPLVVIPAFRTQCASATPRVDVDAVMTGLGESLWLENTKSHEGRKEKEEEERKETSTEKKDLGCVPVFIRSLTGRTLKLLISPHDDVSTLLSMVEGLVHIPRHLWYARANGKPLPDLSMPHGLLRDDIVTMHGRLAGGALPPRVPGEWFCQVCQRGGCWPVRSSCFRCGRPRKECEAVNTPHVVPPRERQFLGRAPAQANNSGCPTERRPSPQGVRKQTGGNDKGAVARMVLEALSCLDLDGEVLNKIRAQLVPPPPAPKPSRILADLEVKIDKAQNDLARLQKVVVTKQAELHQADERANCKAKEVRELHAEMMRVKKEVIQVAPPAPPPTTPPQIPVVVLTGEEGGGDDGDITPMAQEDDALLGLHHGAFEVHDMEDENDGMPEDDCLAQVKRVKATPSLTFEQTCEFIGSGHFTSDQLAEITQIASMRSDSMSQGTIG